MTFYWCAAAFGFKYDMFFWRQSTAWVMPFRTLYIRHIYIYYACLGKACIHGCWSGNHLRENKISLEDGPYSHAELCVVEHNPESPRLLLLCLYSLSSIDAILYMSNSNRNYDIGNHANSWRTSWWRYRTTHRRLSIFFHRFKPLLPISSIMARALSFAAIFMFAVVMISASAQTLRVSTSTNRHFLFDTPNMIAITSRVLMADPFHPSLHDSRGSRRQRPLSNFSALALLPFNRMGAWIAVGRWVNTMLCSRRTLDIPWESCKCPYTCISSNGKA